MAFLLNFSPENAFLQLCMDHAKDKEIEAQDISSVNAHMEFLY